MDVSKAVGSYSFKLVIEVFHRSYGEDRSLDGNFKLDRHKLLLEEGVLISFILEEIEIFGVKLIARVGELDVEGVVKVCVVKFVSMSRLWDLSFFKQIKFHKVRFNIMAASIVVVLPLIAHFKVINVSSILSYD